MTRRSARRSRAIIMVSAHWDTAVPTVGRPTGWTPFTIFWGFLNPYMKSATGQRFAAKPQAKWLPP